MIVDGWMNQAYSRLSTTHGHITDCKLLVCMYWTRLVLVRPAVSLYSVSPLKHHPTVCMIVDCLQFPILYDIHVARAFVLEIFRDLKQRAVHVEGSPFQITTSCFKWYTDVTAMLKHYHTCRPPGVLYREIYFVHVVYNQQ